MIITHISKGIFSLGCKYYHSAIFFIFHVVATIRSIPQKNYDKDDYGRHL